MADRKITLDVGAILDKQFGIENRGYAPVEVDQFLDIVVRDYDAFDQTITELREELENVKRENERLQQRVEELKGEAPEENNAQNVNSLSQLDILRRIARLEQEVFNK